MWQHDYQSHSLGMNYWTHTIENVSKTIQKWDSDNKHLGCIWIQLERFRLPLAHVGAQTASQRSGSRQISLQTSRLWKQTIPTKQPRTIGPVDSTPEDSKSPGDTTTRKGLSLALFSRNNGPGTSYRSVEWTHYLPIAWREALGTATENAHRICGCSS